MSQAFGVSSKKEITVQVERLNMVVRTVGIMLLIYVLVPLSTLGSSLTPPALPPSPPNDFFTNSTVLEGSLVSLEASNVGATKEPSEPNHAGLNGSASIWWDWVAPGDGTLNLSAGADCVPALAAYTGNAVSNLYEHSSGLGSVSVSVLSGVRYHLVADTSEAATCPLFPLGLRFYGFPSNDHFTNAIRLGGISNSVTAWNVGATKEVGEPEHAPYANNASVWWAWEAPTGGRGHVRVSETFDTLVGVYVGDQLTNLTAVGNGNTEAYFDVVAGQIYYIAVAGQVESQGEFVLEHRLMVNAPTDDFDKRPRVVGYFSALTGNGVGTANQPGEPPNTAQWLAWVAPSNEYVSASVDWVTPPAYLSVFAGSNLEELVSADGNELITMGSLITFWASAGTEYQFAVAPGAGLFSLKAVAASSLIHCDLAKSGREPDGSCRLAIEGVYRQRFTIDVSSDLREWVEIFRARMPEETFYFIDADAALLPARFYRVLPKD